MKSNLFNEILNHVDMINLSDNYDFNKFIKIKDYYTDLSEDKNEMFIYIPLAGYNKEKIEITTEKEQIMIEAKSEFNFIEDFKMKINNVDSFDIEKINGEFNDGMLKLTLPKKEEHKPKKIKIK